MAAWNVGPACRDMAPAARLDDLPVGEPLNHGTALVFRGNVATTLATGVTTTLISDWRTWQCCSTGSRRLRCAWW